MEDEEEGQAQETIINTSVDYEEGCACESATIMELW
jgi:hypothetical protein